MQDGATNHTTNVNINFLVENFRGRILARRSERFWLAYSPDLNVLDFCIWGFIQDQIYPIKPETIEERS